MQFQIIVQGSPVRSLLVVPLSGFGPARVPMLASYNIYYYYISSILDQRASKVLEVGDPLIEETLKGLLGSQSIPRAQGHKPADTHRGCHTPAS